MIFKYWITVAFIVGIVGLAMPVTACAYNHNPIFASYLNGCAFGCTSAKDGDADYSTTYRNLIDPIGMKRKNDH